MKCLRDAPAWCTTSAAWRIKRPRRAFSRCGPTTNKKSTKIDRMVAHYTGQAELAQSIQEGLEARGRGDMEQATALLGEGRQDCARIGQRIDRQTAAQRGRYSGCGEGHGEAQKRGRQGRRDGAGDSLHQDRAHREDVVTGEQPWQFILVRKATNRASPISVRNAEPRSRAQPAPAAPSDRALS